MTETVGGGAGEAPVTTTPERDPALVLAGLHLRLGSLALARAELESLAAQGGLDQAGRVDLAEVRWRTGDLIRAGEAARESLASGDESVIALVVAAEAAAALGRPTESRRLATQAQARIDGPIDPVFSGMPRSGVWPADPAEPVPSPTTLFPTDRSMPGHGLLDHGATDDAGSGAGSTTGTNGTGGRAPGPIQATTDGPPTGHPGHPGPGFWDDLPTVESAAADGSPSEAAPPSDLALPREPGPPAGLDPAAILDAGEAALAAGDYASAALHLGLVVRVAPAIAPAVLSAIGDTPDAGLQMVRGDAYRVLGREVDARRAYEGAMSAAADPGSPDARAGDEPPAGAAPLDSPPTPRSTESSTRVGEVEPPAFLLGRPSDDDDGRDPFAGEP